MQLKVEINSDYEKEWIKTLLDGRYRFQKFALNLNHSMNELVSHICESLSLSAEIEFTCYVNVHRFFEVYFQKLEELVSADSNEPLEDKWEHYIASVEERVILFVINLIYICTKYIDNTIAISTTTLLEFLRKIYRPCEIDAFKQTEFRILHLIEFEIQPPTAYYSALYHLQICLANEPKDPINIYNTLKDVLRIAFLRMTEIFQRINTVTLENVEEYNCDQALLGLATVWTVFELSKYPPQIIMKNLQITSAANNITMQDIITLSKSIMTSIDETTDMETE